jgi:hypothetical protein
MALDMRRPDTEQNLPLVTIDIPSKALAELDGLKPKDVVKVVLEGTVVEVSRREPDLSTPGFAGMLRLEVRRVTTRKIDDSFAELADDDG